MWHLNLNEGKLKWAVGCTLLKSVYPLHVVQCIRQPMAFFITVVKMSNVVCQFHFCYD